jgi:hypothetical protein
VRVYAWWAVLCLVGLDYFSTLAYLPSIAVADMKGQAPLAAIGVVVITLLAAVPVYFYVVGRSPHGHGATGLLERRLHGWGGKLFILALLGFIATDFVITRSLSVADASIHILGNPFWKEHSHWVTHNKEVVRGWFPEFLRGRFFDFWDEQLVLTVILSVLAFGLYAFLVRSLTRGFLKIAVFVVGLYLLLNAVVVGSGLVYLFQHPESFKVMWREIGIPRGMSGQLWLLLPLLAFPPLALGLSGFELSMANAPLVKGATGDDPNHPRMRIRNTRKMLVAAALIMCVFVVGSILVVSLLVPYQAIVPADQDVKHRALAYLAHGEPLAVGGDGTKINPLFGQWFGSLYDLSSVLILCLAGASATVGMRDMVPEYLARYGMELRWAHRIGVILHLFNITILIVVVLFHASVTKQQWVYATCVLMLMLCASLAATLEVRHRWRHSFGGFLLSLPFLLITLLFLFMMVFNVIRDASGLAIALIFVAVIMVSGFVSRYLRSTEMRFEGFQFADEHTHKRWEEICLLEFQVLVPHNPGRLTLADKDREIRLRHRLGADVPIIFVEAELGDPSDFAQHPVMKIEEQDGMEIVRVWRCSSIAHVIAAIGLAFREVGQPPEIHFGWSEESPMAANLNFLFLGQGNIPWMVHSLIRKAEPNEVRRPRVVIG